MSKCSMVRGTAWCWRRPGTCSNGREISRNRKVLQVQEDAVSSYFDGCLLLLSRNRKAFQESSLTMQTIHTRLLQHDVQAGHLGWSFPLFKLMLTSLQQDVLSSGYEEVAALHFLSQCPASFFQSTSPRFNLSSRSAGATLLITAYNTYPSAGLRKKMNKVLQ